MPTNAALTISAAGSSLSFSVSDGSLPVITNWGRGFGENDAGIAEQLAATDAPAIMHSSFDAPRRISIAPSQYDGWSGTPAVELAREGRAVYPRLSVASSFADASTAGFVLEDEKAQVRLQLAYSFDAAGVLSAAAEVTNLGETLLTVSSVRVLLPLPGTADEILDLTGRWSGERQPQRTPVADAARHRTARRGRTGHDSPLLTMVGRTGFGFRTGEVWGAHIAWSGNSDYLVERYSEGVGVLGSMLGGGEHLEPAEVELEPGASYTAPVMMFVWSDEGIDGLSARLHAKVRASTGYPTTERPLVLNTWEAVYFDHDLDRLLALAEVARDVGVERFVLDDGWFLRRRDDQAGLGDWSVDTSVWPDGLLPLAEGVRKLGMEFGLWFEPEMLNLNSDLVRSHPDWLLAADPVGPSWRFQYLLNLAHPDAWAYLLEEISALVAEIGIAFIKWDHNRDLHEAVDRRTGKAGVRAQTLATYALIDELRRRHPRLEIESCASGGARVDLGILPRTQRIWASDTNDAIERQRIQRWTGVLVPPELVGSHVGPKRAHTTGRELDLPFRLTTALFGHSGIEWDISGCTDDERAALTEWARTYKEYRSLIGIGRTVRADGLRHGSMLHGLVAPDGGRALYAWAQLDTSPVATSERVVLPGLTAGRPYSVVLSEPFGKASRRSIADPAWISSAPTTFDGAMLSTIGLPLPVLNPGQAVLLEVAAV